VDAADRNRGNIGPAILSQRSGNREVVGDALETMDEVGHRAVRQARHQRGFTGKAKRIPADLRDFLARLRDKTDHLAWNQSEAAVRAHFLAGVEEHLHADTNPEEWPSGARRIQRGLFEPTFAQRVDRGPERAHTR